MSDTTITPPGGETPENATIRQMREQIATEKRRADENAQKLTDIERGKLADTERLTLELADRDKKLTELGAKASKVDQYETAFQTLYTQELAGVPEAARASVERLSKAGDWNQRLDALRDARGLLAPAAPVPPVAGTITQPTGGTPAPTPAAPNLQPAKPLTAEELRATDFGQILKNRPVVKTTQ